MPPSATSTADSIGAPSPRLAILALSQGGCRLGQELASKLGGDFFACKGRLAKQMGTVWKEYDQIICIMATGIVVRTIAPLIKDKYQDPAIVVCDELGRFAISLISGHLGGANALAEQVAAATGGQPVLTTASDVLGKTALDLWCRDRGFLVADKALFTRAMGKLVDRGVLHVWSPYPLGTLPKDLHRVEEPAQADLIIDCRAEYGTSKALLIPKTLVVGTGCNRGTPAELIIQVIHKSCEEHGLLPQAIARLASIDLKQDEIGLLAAARELGLEIDFYSKDQLNGVEEVSTSAAVLKATGAKGVAEPAALLSAGDGAHLLVPKMKWVDATTAIAERATL
ncbi:cobalamin biosynthesis protein [Desulfobulbus rhabdoformis]|uniref:cobalt-precorrin 5A hydrolase n=1 Tax=Desulfobulbus rhabdoformis TaxID=34032 RepID=UPI001962EF2D|nr:cobalamin biosynthesis protein [Desulfobulbus rhabdoformis]MBM9613771.1 cobalamin biosynthesis protein [Desulfobulbus rhabdoformis]